MDRRIMVTLRFTTLKMRCVNDRKARQEIDDIRLTCRVVQYVCEALYRYRHYENRRDCAILQVFASATLQAQAGAR